MLVQLIASLLFVTIVTSKSVTLDDDRYIIALYNNATLQDVENVMESIRQQEMQDEELTKMRYVNETLPILMSYISEETANKIAQLPEVKYVGKDQDVNMSLIGEPGYNVSRELELNLSTDMGEKIVEKFETADLYAGSPYVLVHRIGGGGGGSFSFYGGHDGSLLKKIGVWVGGWQVKAVKIWRTNGVSQTFGVPSGPYKEHTFQPGEKITSMSLWGNGAGSRLGAIKFKTDKNGEFFAKMTSWGLKQEYPIDVGSGVCVGVLGRSGSDIDSMGFIFIKPLRSSQMINVNYPTIGYDTAKVQVSTLRRVKYANPYSHSQTFHLELTETRTKVEHWEVTAGLEASYSVSVTAGIPEVVEVTAGWTVKVSISGTYGMSTSTTRTETWKFPIVVPAHSDTIATVSLGKANVNLPYTAKIVMTTTDGSKLEFNVSGVYKGVSYSNVSVKLTST